MLVETFKNRYLRYFLTLFGLLGVLLSSVSVAYGADQGYGSFWYGPNEKTVEGVTYLKTGVVASNKYDAALYALGFSKSTVNGISNTKKNKLINNSTFSSFANGFRTGKPDDDAIGLIPGIPTVGLYADNMLTTWYASSAVYGESNCYWGIYSEDAADSAEDAAYTIIKSGSESGGGSGGGSGGDPGTNESDFPTQTAIYVDDYALMPVVEWVEGIENPVTHVAVKKDVFVAASETARQYGYVLFTGFNGSQMFLVSAPYNGIEFYENGHNIVYVGSWIGKPCYYLQTGSVAVRDLGGYRCAVTDSAGGVGTAGGVMEGTRNILYCSWIYPDGTGEDPEPPIDWPVEPPTPTPPEPPEPVEPDPPTPWNPIPDIDIDITGDDFQDLLDALNEHCLHLQSSISSNISQLWQLQSDLFSDHMNTFWDNLHNDLLWLGECLNFDVNVNVDTGGGDGGGDSGGEGETNTFVPFDDSSVIYWLKQIWSKMGNGVSIRPVDPVTQSDDWWAWLLSLIRDFAALLLGFGAGSLGAVTSGLQSLTGKFPFSLPWDLVAMFALLDAPPVVPAFDLPCFAVTDSGISEVGQYHITLEAFDDVWDGIRWVERIGFAVMLIRSTGMITGLMRKAVGRD